jgi:hypothetical protein
MRHSIARAGSAAIAGASGAIPKCDQAPRARRRLAGMSQETIAGIRIPDSAGARGD